MRRMLPHPEMVGSLFSGHYESTGWVAPTELPDLGRYPFNEHFGYDTEATSKDAFIAQPVGLALCTPDRKRYYLPFGHRAGGNLDPNLVKRWANRELRGRHLCALNAKYDLHVSLNWGLDLEELGCTLHDPAFQAALLDENRRRFNLDLLSSEILGLHKLDTFGEKHDIADCAASEVAAYAQLDAFLHLELDAKQQPDIDAQGLNKVCDLEDQLIFATSAMERAGARIDRPKLERWIKEVELAHQEAILKIYSIAGIRVNPNSVKDMRLLFDALHLEYPRREEELGGEVTFEDEYLSKVTHPCVRAAIAARKLDSLNSKYLRKYLKLLDFNNILRYSLHQLRGDEYGTVTGRFASANVNIQQVMKVESQQEEEEICAWIVRELFISEDGRLYVSADASQIEFRWFASYSKSERLIKAYVEDPTIDFHQLVANLLGQKRKDAKHNNFGRLYAMGIVKLARRLGYKCNCGCDTHVAWDRKQHSLDCKIMKAFDIGDQYDERFPEAKKLTQQAMTVAKQRGFVHTIMGRRRRFPTGERLHSALNAVIQGSAADTLKVKMLESYRFRKQLGLFLRMCVHDELDGDIEEERKAKEWKELLEAPDSRIPCRVPLLWEVKTGSNWKECTA
jgi:DNA polymerase-1